MSDPYLFEMLRIPAVLLISVSITFLILALKKLSKKSISGCSHELLDKASMLRVVAGFFIVCFFLMAVQFIREGNQLQGFREDTFGAIVSVLIGAFVFLATGIINHTAGLFNELVSMRALAHQDALTGLYNRRYFDTALQKAIELARMAREPLSLIAIDLDNFKQVNDRHGHAFGDEVIRRVSEMIARESRARDAVVRLGGDELMIIAQGTGDEAAVLFAERVRQLVADIDIVTPQNGAFNISISIGIANHREGEAASELISRADEAMYRSKMGGRNRVHSDQPEVSFPALDLAFSTARVLS